MGQLSGEEQVSYISETLKSCRSGEVIFLAEELQKRISKDPTILDHMSSLLWTVADVAENTMGGSSGIQINYNALERFIFLN